MSFGGMDLSALEGFDYDEFLRLQEEEEEARRNGGFNTDYRPIPGVPAFDQTAIDQMVAQRGADIGGPQGLGGAGTTAGLNNAAVLAWLESEGAQNMLGGAPAATTAAPAGEIDLMGDLMGDPSLGYTMDPSGYRVDASGNIVDPEGNVTGMMPSGGGDYDASAQGGFRDDYRYKDERPAMREQAYADALAGTGDFAETGPISLEDLQQFLGVVGTEDWFKHLQGQEDVNALYGDKIVDALARIDETGTATLPWIESREFEEKYGSPDGTPAVDGPVDDGPVVDGPVGDGPVVDGPVVDGPVGDGLGEDVPPMFMPGGADEPTDLGTAPPGVPTFVQGQIDSLNIINNRFAEIEKVAKTLRDAGLADLEGIGEELKAAEQAIFEDQYGPGIEGPDGQLLDPGEMDRFWNTYKARQKTSKKDRETDRAKVVEIIEKEGVEPGLAKSQMDMITALHGDSVDAMFDYVDSMWRIGKLSHDERDSMINSVIASYQADLRSQVIDMLMVEGVATAEDRAAINEEARTADAIAGLFPGITEDQVYGLMTGGMENLLELPEEDPTGTITSGPWEGYTKGQQANAFLNKGYEYDSATQTWTLPEDDPITGLIKSGAWAGYTEGEKSAKLASLGWTQDDTDQWVPPVDPTGAGAAPGAQGGFMIDLGTLADSGIDQATAEGYGWTVRPDGTMYMMGDAYDAQVYGTLNPEEAVEKAEGDLKTRVSVDRINQLDPTGEFLKGYEILGATGATGRVVIGGQGGTVIPAQEAYSGYVEIPDAEWPFDENPYEAGEEPEDTFAVQLSYMTNGREDGGLGMTEEQIRGYFGADSISGAYVNALPSKWGSVLGTTPMIQSTVAEQRFDTKDPSGADWSGTAAEYYNQFGEYIFGEQPRVYDVEDPAGNDWSGTAQMYYNEFGEYIFAEEEDEYDPFLRYDTGLTMEDVYGPDYDSATDTPPLGSELDADTNTLWMTPDDRANLVRELNLPTEMTHGSQAGVTLAFAMSDLAPANYWTNLLYPGMQEWNNYLNDKHSELAYTDDGRLSESAIRAWSPHYLTPARLVAHMDNRVVTGSDLTTGFDVQSPTRPRHHTSQQHTLPVADRPTKPFFAAVPIAGGEVVIVEGNTAAEVKKTVEEDYPNAKWRSA